MKFFKSYIKPQYIDSKAVLKHSHELGKMLKEHPVSLVFLHGSVAKDQYKTLSDIDIAILFKNNDYSLDDIHKIYQILEDTLGREDIDLAVLNKASPLFCMQVLRNSKILYKVDEASLTSFRLKTIQRYLHTKYLRMRFHQYQKQAILGKV